MNRAAQEQVSNLKTLLACKSEYELLFTAFALEGNGGRNHREAADFLGISERTFYRRLDRIRAFAHSFSEEI